MQSNHQLHPWERSDDAQALLLGMRGLLQMLLHPRKGQKQEEHSPRPTFTSHTPLLKCV